MVLPTAVGGLGGPPITDSQIDDNDGKQ